jgi:hypothetical protein
MMDDIIYYPDDRPLTWPEKQAVWRGEDMRAFPRLRRAAADELAHSCAPEIDLDDPVVLSEEYWDIWTGVTTTKKRKGR